MGERREQVTHFEVTEDGEWLFTTPPHYEPNSGWDPLSFFEEMVDGLEGKRLRFVVEVLDEPPADRCAHPPAKTWRDEDGEWHCDVCEPPAGEVRK